MLLFDVLGVLAQRRYQAAERAFAALGLNHTEARLLTLLREAGGAAAQDALAQALFVDRTNAGRALQRLEQAGYVVRRSDETDRRANRVEITSQGRKAASEIVKLRKKLAQTFFRDLPEDAAGAIVALLRKALTDEEYERVRRRLERDAGE